MPEAYWTDMLTSRLLIVAVCRSVSSQVLHSFPIYFGTGTARSNQTYSAPPKTPISRQTRSTTTLQSLHTLTPFSNGTIQLLSRPTHSQCHPSACSAAREGHSLIANSRYASRYSTHSNEVDELATRAVTRTTPHPPCDHCTPMFWHRRRCAVQGNAIIYPPATAENISRCRPGQTMRICKTRPHLYVAIPAKSHNSLLA